MRMVRGILLAGAVAAAGVLAQPASAAELSQAARGEVEQIVRDYLLKNPELLLEVMERLEQKQKQSARDDATRAIEENKQALFSSADDFVYNEDGRVPIVEFFDYQCGYCKRMLPSAVADEFPRFAHVVRLLDENRSVRFIYKELPILGDASTVASRAALASKKQGRYIDFHNALMALRRPLDEDAVFDVAEDVGLDVARLRTDMEDPAIDEIIERNRALAQTMGLRGTPSFVIGDVLVPGAIEYDKMIALVARMKESCQVC